MTGYVSGAGLKRQIVFWLLALTAFILFLFVFSNILLPFIAGLALAYFLDPVADRLERLGLSRTMATVFILFAFLVVFALSLMIVIPLLATQAADFFANLPGYITQLQQLVTSFDPSLLPGWISGQMDTIKQSFSTILGEGAGFLGTLLKQIWNSGMALVNVASLLVITPVVAFYMLLDWDRMVLRVDDMIPRDHLDTVRRLAREINDAIAGFVRGQGSICIILGLFYGVSLSFAGLNFGLLIGLFAGLISFIPYVGSLVGLLLSIGVAVVQFWPDYISIGIVVAIFFAGQFLEGNILQPKLVGSRVGLHPVWLMFALFAFGALFGFVGLLVAVPAAAAVGVLVRFGVERYLDSDLYHGHSQAGPLLRGRPAPRDDGDA
ncbi:AI-2E family transporter [Shinella daejeonensis]|uniref:AI-2E family transporter n=1 Tax=Shinella daejeonensis TaxID=659017 RepID=UPI0020C78E62|nr:AI-2E family transporter [Shinella daejeonensis]MCP8895669.1 AI-2E family transporter [Shinella daejeonensis]